MTPRDPLAELWTARARNRSGAGLVVPVKHPATGGTVWLSIGQWLTLLDIRRHRYRSRTYLAIATATATHPGAVTHRLDRLAQLGLLGRQATVGRGHRTRFWPPSSTIRPRSWQPGLNVATSTAYGGLNPAYVSLAGVRRAWSRAGSPPEPPGGGTLPPARRRRPPRLLHELCPLDGGRVFLAAWRFRRTTRAGKDRLMATWDGVCPTCHNHVIAPLVLEADPPDLTGVDGRLPRRPPNVIEPDRLDRILELAAVYVADPDLDPAIRERIGAAWLGWTAERIPHPAVVVVDPADAEQARRELWDEVARWSAVRYSQPASSPAEPDSLVRDSQLPAGGVDS